MDGFNDSLVELKETQARLSELYVWVRCGECVRLAAGALSCLGGGIIAGASGALLSALAWTRGGAGGGLSAHNVGSVLLLSTIPLLALGAHCLDMLDVRLEKSRRPETSETSESARESHAAVSSERARRALKSEREAAAQRRSQSAARPGGASQSARLRT